MATENRGASSADEVEEEEEISRPMRKPRGKYISPSSTILKAPTPEVKDQQPKKKTNKRKLSVEAGDDKFMVLEELVDDNGVKKATSDFSEGSEVEEENIDKLPGAS